MKLDKEFIEKVRGPILATWEYIGHDCYACAREAGERLTNAAAIEGCIDAERLYHSFDGKRRESGKSANDLIELAIKEHGYTKMFSYLKRHIQLT